MEAVVNALVLAVLAIVMIAVLVGGVWFALASDGVGDIADEEPTLNTRGPD